MQAVEFESVSKSFAEKNVIEDISFSLMQGEIFGFLGQTGQEK
jgi:ABC-2 type transport system ATP-binding protein